MYVNERALSKANKVFKKYIVDDLGIMHETFETLTESHKINIGGQVVATVLNDIKDKMVENDELKSSYLLSIYKTKGDIKQLEFLDELQEAVFKLERMIDEYNLDEVKKPVELIIETLVGLNKYTSIYVDAFRNKKTMLILQYVGLIRSLITSIVYVLSKSCDISSSGEVLPKDKIIIENILPLKALNDFVNIVKYNNLNKIAQDVSMLREGYVEYTAEQLYFITEARDIMSMIIGGVENIYDKITKTVKSPILPRLLYKTSSIILLVLSFRNMFFTNFRMNNTVDGILKYVGDFNNSANGKIKSGINNTSKSIAVDIENASDNATYDVRDQDRDILKISSEKTKQTSDDGAPVDESTWTDF